MIVLCNTDELRGCEFTELENNISNGGLLALQSKGIVKLSHSFFIKWLLILIGITEKNIRRFQSKGTSSGSIL